MPAASSWVTARASDDGDRDGDQRGGSPTRGSRRRSATTATATLDRDQQAELDLDRADPVERPEAFTARPPGRSRRRAPCGPGRRRACARSDFTWLSTVRVPEASAQPQTSASSCSRVSTVPGLRGEADQQVELGRRQVHLLAVDAHPARGAVDRAASPTSSGRRRRDGQLGGPLDPAQQRPDPRDQLPHAERLGQVVVRPDAEPHQQVGLVVAGGEHQHRHRPLRLDRRHTSWPSKPGSMTSRTHEVRLPLGSGLDGAGPSYACRRRIPRRPAGGDGLGDRRLVLDHEDAWSPRSCPCGRA